MAGLFSIYDQKLCSAILDEPASAGLFAHVVSLIVYSVADINNWDREVLGPSFVLVLRSEMKK